MEIVPGIHRIESVLGPRPFSQYLLWGERSLLVDTGIVSTPAEVILPYFARVGFNPANLDYVLISHADVDHFGGNAAIRAVAPAAIFCAHEQDAGWIEDRERILRERYGWYAAHGPAADYDAATKAWLRDAMGDDIPVNLRLRGGEVFELGPGLAVEVLHLPGHSQGHVGLWESASRTAIVIDAVLGNGLYDLEGKVIHPPPYVHAAAYEETIAKLQALRPRLLLTAHYAPMAGEEVDRFLADSAAFVKRARAAVAERVENEGEVTLAGLLAELDPVLGPFTSMPIELGGPIWSHLRELTGRGVVIEVEGADPPVWRKVRN
jgi:glyoxylase-like metal-dependent hydrolase (beta-lactamase superfamily II)